MAKLKQKDFLAELARLAESMRRTIEAECGGFAADAAASKERRDRVQSDFAFFRHTYFPHYSRYGDSVLHAWLDKTLPALVDHPDGQRLACAAPRGEAKSTIVAMIFVLWCLLTGRKRYVILIADAFEQAAALLEAVKVELEANPRLGMDWPDAVGMGRVWNVGVAITAGGAKLQAFGSGKRMRGLRHGPHRPDLVICDDLENDENVKSPEQRDKLQSWLQKTVLSLGEAGDTMDVILVGTVLHYDSVLARLLGNRLWRSRKFQAVIQWPDRMDLWDRWEEILLALGEEAAQVFYAKAGKAMEKGTVVSWPSARPFYKLMLKRARDGHAAFDSEQQNDPLSGEDAPDFQTDLKRLADMEKMRTAFGRIDSTNALDVLQKTNIFEFSAIIRRMLWTFAYSANKSLLPFEEWCDALFEYDTTEASKTVMDLVNDNFFLMLGVAKPREIQST